MKPLLLVVTSSVIATAAAVAVVQLGPRGSSEADASEASGALGPRGEDLGERVASLEAAIEQLTEQIAAKAAPQRALAPQVDEATVRRAVAAWLESADDPKAAAKKIAAAKSGTGAAFDLAATFAKVTRPGLTFDERTSLWQALSKENQDELVAEFERLAEENPHNADAQNVLGEAYVQRLFNGTFIEMMKFGQLAEKSFDKALELDDRHWGARFNKAMSLANQPDFLGKRPDAIKHFEILLKQQESGVREDRHAGTYLFLGNLYTQQGDPKKAQEIWERGLKRFPSSGDLKGRLNK